MSEMFKGCPFHPITNAAREVCTGHLGRLWALCSVLYSHLWVLFSLPAISSLGIQLSLCVSGCMFLFLCVYMCVHDTDCVCACVHGIDCCCVCVCVHGFDVMFGTTLVLGWPCLPSGTRLWDLEQGGCCYPASSSLRACVCTCICECAW